MHAESEYKSRFVGIKAENVINRLKIHGCIYFGKGRGRLKEKNNKNNKITRTTCMSTARLYEHTYSLAVQVFVGDLPIFYVLKPCSLFYALGVLQRRTADSVYKKQKNDAFVGIRRKGDCNTPFAIHVESRV